MNLAKDSTKLFLSRIVGIIFANIGTIYFARELGPEEIGIFFLFQALAQMLAVPADMGLQSAVIKRMSEGENKSNILSTVILLLGLLLSLVTVGVLTFRSYINSYLGAQLAIFLAIVVILNEFAKLVTNVLKGELRVGETAILNIAQQTVYTSLGGVLIYSGEGAFGLVLAFLAGILVVLLLGVAKLSTSLGKPTMRSAISLFNYSKYSVVAYVDNYLYNWLDVLVIGLFLTQSDIGIYEIAWRISVLVMIFSGVIETTILPQISAWDSQDQIKKIESVLPNAILASIFFVIPAFFGGLIISKELLFYIFGEKYASAWLVLIILMSGKIFEAVDRILKNIMSGMDRPDLRAIAVLASISLNLLLNFSLVNIIGLTGAAIATTASFAASTVIIWYYLTHMIDIVIPYRSLGSCVLASIGMAIILSGAKSVFGISSIFSLIAFILVGAILYVVLTSMFPDLREKEKMALKSVIRTSQSILG